MNTKRSAKAPPGTEYAVELIGPGRLRLNIAKKVTPPGPHQILARVEAVGLCFSDLKLLKLFDRHPRKSEITSGIPQEILAGMASYVPGTRPTVPGHEAVCRIVAVGGEVRHHKVGERVLVQADYRSLLTGESNAAFGYNFEGALQEYVTTDERVVMDKVTGERLLIPVGEGLSASAVALVEPWACVEQSYASAHRRAPKAGGGMLVVADQGHAVRGLSRAVALSGAPAKMVAVCAENAQLAAVRALGVPTVTAKDARSLGDEGFDDVIYFGARKETIEVLGDKLAARGIINIVTAGASIGSAVSIGVGRIHYGRTRWIGTTGASAAEAYSHIPATGEIRPADRVLIIGAGGPMGQMHVIRSILSGVAGIEVTAADLDGERLASLAAKVLPLATERNVVFRVANAAWRGAGGAPTYVGLMVPVASLVAEAIEESAPGCLINIFAGIPADTHAPVDMDRYITKRCYMFGTSGSTTADMRTVLAKVEGGRLDTNASVDAVSGMAGAIDGIRAVEKRTLAGKIVVYPALHNLPLVRLSDLPERLPGVAARLSGGAWCRAAEDELLATADA